MIVNDIINLNNCNLIHYKLKYYVDSRCNGVEAHLQLSLYIASITLYCGCCRIILNHCHIVSRHRLVSQTCRHRRRRRRCCENNIVAYTNLTVINCCMVSPQIAIP